MEFPLCLGLAIASIFFLIIYFIFSFKSYKKRFNLVYNPKNYFPYEIGYRVRFLDNIGLNALLILSMFFSFALFIYYGYGYNMMENSKLITIIAGILLSFCIFFLFFADLKYTRFHIFLFVLTALAAFLLPAGIAILGFVDFQKTGDIYPIIIGILSAIFAIFIFASLMNPRLSLQLNMKKAVDANGKEVLVRPRYFVLAFTEWVYIFSIIIDQILLILLIIPR